MEWKEWIGRKIFVRLISGKVYSGIVKDCKDEFLEITDKFNLAVSFKITEIAEIKEEKKRYEND